MKRLKYLIFFILFFSSNLFAVGSVIFLTGPSSSGKTTILNELKKKNLYCEYLSCDDFVQQEFWRAVRSTVLSNWVVEYYYYSYLCLEEGRTDLALLETLAEEGGFNNFTNKILELVNQNKNVVCECVLPSGDEKIKQFFNCFKNIKMFKVLIYASINDIGAFVECRNSNAREEGYRDFSSVLVQFCEYFVKYNISMGEENCIGVVNNIEFHEALLKVDKRIKKDVKFDKILEHFNLSDDSNSLLMVAIAPKLKYNLVIRNIYKDSIEEKANEILCYAENFVTQ